MLIKSEHAREDIGDPLPWDGIIRWLEDLFLYSWMTTEPLVEEANLQYSLESEETY
jgi:hypothetical protein